MKKIFLILVITILLSGCSNGNLKKINYEDLNQKLENKETFILYFDSSEQGTLLMDTLNKVLTKYELKGYLLNADKLSEDEVNELSLKIDFETPSIVFVQEGVDPSILSHVTNQSITEEEIINRLKDMKYITE